MVRSRTKGKMHTPNTTVQNRVLLPKLNLKVSHWRSASNWLKVIW